VHSKKAVHTQQDRHDSASLHTMTVLLPQVLLAPLCFQLPVLLVVSCKSVEESPIKAKPPKKRRKAVFGIRFATDSCEKTMLAVLQGAAPENSTASLHHSNLPTSVIKLSSQL